MPVKRCVLNGKLGYKWGDQGKCYTYDSGNEQQREAARQKALKQGRAAQVVKKDGKK